MTHILEQIYSVIEGRKTADPDSSYVASLFDRGTSKIAQKVGEEAVEAVIEAMQQNPDKLRAESADLLFHLMVLWADQGIKPEEVFEILQNRIGISGLEEKANRNGE